MTADADAFARPRLVAFFLVAGSVLIGVPTLFHPILVGDGTAQLTAIAATAGWRVIHLAIAFGYVLAVAGLAGVSGLDAVKSERSVVRIGASLSILGYAVSLVGVLFMLGAAHAMAGAFQPHAGQVGTDVALLYDLLHPFALAALRVGAFAVSVGISALGWAVKAGRSWPRWLGWLGLAAGLIGAVVAIFLSEHSPAIVTGIGLAVVWQLVVGVLLLVRPARKSTADAALRAGRAAKTIK